MSVVGAPQSSALEWAIGSRRLPFTVCHLSGQLQLQRERSDDNDTISNKNSEDSYYNDNSEMLKCLAKKV